MNYYTYLLINLNNNMMYIGKRQCKCLPEDDTAYMGSSKYVPTLECDKIILNTFSTPEELTQEEIRLHALYDVGINPQFYNRSKQTSTKFDTTGIKFNLTAEQKLKISVANKGKKRSPDMIKAVAEHLSQFRTPEIRRKAADSLITNGSNKGTKNSQFRPWFISTPTVTYLFTDISKNEKSIQDGFKNIKHYTDLQRKLVKGPIKHKIYGLVIAMGNLPEQYKI